MRNPVSLTCVLALILFSAHAEETEHTLVKPGDKLPDIELSTLDGEKVNGDNMRGEVTLLVFFATWCGPCQSELPRIEREVWQEFRDDGLNVVVVGREHSAAELADYKSEQAFTFPMAPDPERAVYGKFAAEFIPRTFLIGRDGRIVHSTIGYDEASFEGLVASVEESLETPRPAKATAKEKAEAGSKLKGVEISGETRIRVQHRDRL